MTRQVQLRSRAASDIDEAIASLRRDADNVVALAFIDELEQVVDLVRRSPNVGSLRFSYDLGIPGLRARSLKRFPYLVFYVPFDDRIDVWRVLHTRRDIPNTLTREV